MTQNCAKARQTARQTGVGPPSSASWQSSYWALSSCSPSGRSVSFGRNGVRRVGLRPRQRQPRLHSAVRRPRRRPRPPPAPSFTPHVRIVTGARPSDAFRRVADGRRQTPARPISGSPTPRVSAHRSIGGHCGRGARSRSAARPLGRLPAAILCAVTCRPSPRTLPPTRSLRFSPATWSRMLLFSRFPFNTFTADL